MENKKHILFISSWYPNRNNPTHGIFNRYFADAAAIYNQISVIHVCSDEQLKSEFECVESTENGILSITVYYRKVNSSIPLISHLLKRKKVLQAFDLAFQKLIQKVSKPDLIQLNVVLPMGLGAYHLSQKHKIPYVVNENWSGYCAEDGNYRGFVMKYLTQKIIRSAKKIMPTSNYLKEAMLAQQLNGSYEVVPNVVNVQRFKPLEEMTHAKTKLLHISSLNDREKNVSGLIRAFAMVLKTEQELELKIVGEGIDKEVYQKLVSGLNIGKYVHFVGRLMADDLVKTINANDALIMFSNYETFSLVIIEAFACGKPVITSNAGAIAGYMKPELGIMVNKNNEKQLSEAILNFTKVKNKFDHNLIRKFAVENYSYEKIGEKLNEIYRDVLK